MRLSLIAACCIAGTTWSTAIANGTQTNPKTAARQTTSTVVRPATKSMQAAAQTRGANPLQLPTQSSLVGGEDCSTAAVVSGTGTFAFDTTGAVTDTQQQTCGGGASADVWFTWTAPATGTTVFSLCGGSTSDSVIAVWAGGGCGTAAVGCNDDFCGLQSQVAFPATAGNSYMLQIGGYSGSIGAGTFSLTQVGAGPANDDCSAAVAITGSGPFNFDTTGATTSVQQSGFCGTSGQDIWYDWTATGTGFASLSLCGSSYDTLVAVYSGAGCPTGGTNACNDDSCALQSVVNFACVAGNHYMLQIGGFGGNFGVGSFTLTIAPPPPPCGPYDDGSTENLLGWGAGGDMVWLSSFGSVGGSSLVSSVDVMWGSALYPNFTPGNGTVTDVFIWVDGATQDGDPSDATLLLTIPTTVQSVDTDTYVTLPITPTTINGIFFVGAHLAHAAGQFVAPMDMTTHPYPGVSWFFGDNTSPLANYANPGANVQPPLTLDAIGWASQFCVRTSCGSGPATYLCDPGASGVIACPCTNPPSGSGRGCDNSSATGGASITGAGLNSLLAPTLNFTTSGEKPTATSIVLQGTLEVTAGITFGQGVRCVGGALRRLYTKTAAAGSITAPSGADADIPTRSAFLGDTISAGQDRWYMVYYRDPIVLGGCSAFSTFNCTNTAKVTWQP